jgi:hypothetical protein
MVTNALGGMARMVGLNGLIPTESGWEMMEARAIAAVRVAWKTAADLWIILEPPLHRRSL